MSDKVNYSASDRHQLANIAFSKLADEYEKRFMNETMYDSSYDALLNELSENNRLLELGCGPGMITKYLLNHIPSLQILATDISHEMLELSKKNNPTAKHQILNIDELKSLDEKYDAIICGFAFPYLSPEEIKMFFKQCERLLVNNGILYISYIIANEFSSKEETGSKSNHKVVVYRYPGQQIESLNKENSFALLHEFIYSFTNGKGMQEEHCAQILKKKSL